MDVLAQLAHNTGYSVRINYNLSTTAAASNKQGDVELLNFSLDGSNNLVNDVSICCDHIGKSTVNNGHLNGKMYTKDYLQERAEIKNRRYRADYAVVGAAFAPAIVSVAGQIHPEFLPLLWVLADKQTRNYCALIGAEEEIGSEAFTWSRPCMFSFNKNSTTTTLLARSSLIPLPHAYTYPCTVQLRRRVVKLASPCPLLNASCTALHMHCCAPPRPAPPRPAVNVDVGAHSAAPSAHATRVGAYEEVDVPRCRRRRSR